MDQSTSDSHSPKTSQKVSPQSGAVPPLSLEGNLSHNWKTWLQHFKIYMRASGLENTDDNRKVAIFLHYVGGNALAIFNSL